MKRKKFINKSNYPGGKEAIQDFIKKNLKYPKEAFEKGIEGDVLVAFKVNSLGKVFQPNIIKGIGHGCDKESIRIIQKLKYPKKINRKVKVTTSKKITIKFRLPNKNIIISYHLVK